MELSRLRKQYIVLAVLAFGSLSTAGLALGQAPEFSFWGNLPHATRMLEYAPELRTEPVPLEDQDKLAQCRIGLGDHLVLIRNGVLAGRGRVGEIRAGWFARAGDDRVVFFIPAGLPDSVAVPTGPVFPKLWDEVFDFYIIGDHGVGLINMGPGHPVEVEDYEDAVNGAMEAGLLEPFEFPHTMLNSHEGRYFLPDTPEAVEWLLGNSEPVEFPIPIDPHGQIQVLDSSPHFVRVEYAGPASPVYLRGSLDYFFEVGGSVFLIMRSGNANSGAWGYKVYQMHHELLPKLVFSDCSWST